MAIIKDEVFKEIIENLKGLSYGTVSITVHNDEITQLDVTEKKRFDLAKVQRQRPTPKLAK